MNRLEWYSTAAKELGVGPLIRRQIERRFNKAAALHMLTSKQLDHPVYARPRTSDHLVFDQIFVEREYKCLDHLDPMKVSLILDCGANVGYSSAYFLSRFPQSYVRAFEPDLENFKMLKHNLAPYGVRGKAIRAAIWPRDEMLDFDASHSGQGDEWGRRLQVSERSTVPVEILPRIINSRVSILKIDIEGAETEVFKADTSWLADVDNIVIELHGPEAEDTFHRAIESHDFEVSRSGELTVCLRH